VSDRCSIRIIPVSLGKIKIDISVFLSLKNFGKKMVAPCIGWYLEGARERILVDTGPSDPDWGTKYHQPLTRSDQETIEGGLSKIGLTPDKITVVINTHLHWDHCYGNKLFTNATFVVQREELRYAVAPLARDRRDYEADLATPPFLSCLSKMQIVEGDKEIVPGVKVIKTPGHTPGSQGVAVKTSNGVYFVAGDTFPLFRNFKDSSPWPPGIFVSLEAFYQSADKILSIADHILPSHDPLVLKKGSYP